MQGVISEGDSGLFFDALDRAAHTQPATDLKRAVLVRIKLGADGNWRLRASPSAPGSVQREDAAMTTEAADFTVRWQREGWAV